jgi:hypothetical protein
VSRSGALCADARSDRRRTGESLFTSTELLAAEKTLIGAAAAEAILIEQVYEWLPSPEHLRPPSTAFLPGQGDRVRRCASQEGVAIW